MAKKRSKERGIKSDETLFSIIEQLRRSGGAGVTELASELQLAKSTVHGHLMALQDRQFVVKRGRSYHLGLEFFNYGQFVRSKIDIFQAGKFAVDRLEEATGEMAWLITHEQGRAMYIYGRSGENDINTNSLLGRWVHMHYNSGGKAILAHLSRERVNQIIDQHGLSAKTNQTITSREEVHKECARVREQGFALNFGEDLEGIHAIGVPLIFEGEIQGALSVAGPAHRLSEERCQSELFEQLRAVTDEIELNLAYQ
ncbi:IclR family transcriptional regulator [Halococcus sp. IIIV-5B]|uniref:IclR family transcriptional regulator n=1 Tax=Halococcus sp. IIIV-5B TaxID=2321230 RepID=UPI000E72304D|nr:IclR family transcriptional regulator [Halococcus sp. IIIV-5B]RJT07914.1 IclR family transcriptional regulator [Halococcus sp. IIIV-5B]